MCSSVDCRPKNTCCLARVSFQDRRHVLTSEMIIHIAGRGGHEHYLAQSAEYSSKQILG